MCHVSAGRCIRSNLFSPPARVRSRLESFVLLVCLPGHVNTPHRFLNRGGWSFMCACVRKNCARIEFDLGRVPVPPHTHTHTHVGTIHLMRPGIFALRTQWRFGGVHPHDGHVRPHQMGTNAHSHTLCCVYLPASYSSHFKRVSESEPNSAYHT